MFLWRNKKNYQFWLKKKKKSYLELCLDENFHFYTRVTTFVISCLLPCAQSPFLKGAYYKSAGMRISMMRIFSVCFMEK